MIENIKYFNLTSNLLKFDVRVYIKPSYNFITQTIYFSTDGLTLDVEYLIGASNEQHPPI